MRVFEIFLFTNKPLLNHALPEVIFFIFNVRYTSYINWIWCVTLNFCPKIIIKTDFQILFYNKSTKIRVRTNINIIHA